MSPGRILLFQIAFLVLLILHTFAGYAFCHLVYLQFRQYRLGKPVWGGWTWRALTLVFAVNYLYFLSGYLSFVFSDGRTGEAPFLAQMAHVLTRPLIGPLVMQLFYITERRRLRDHWLWNAVIRTAWAIAVPVAIARGLGEAPGPTHDWTHGLLDQSLLGASDAVAAAAGILGVTVMVMSRHPDDSAFRRRRRRWYLVLIGLGLGQTLIRDSPWTETCTELLVMAFVVVTVYYGERLTFFDVFAKRGLLFFLALVTLTSEFALVSPRLSLERMTFVKPWVAALAVVPLVLATPWVYATASQWIDRAWLGRRFSIAGAATHFADSLQGAVSEADLFERAESSLSHVFQSRACVDPGSHEAEEDELRATVRVDGTDWGVARVLARPDEVPFLSEDGELLRILARSLGSALEGQRLRDQRLAHDERERTLVLTAAQAELKVLRAQINPHFLFNALNTIAALIPQKPDRAEQILEQLAEVFRYAVRRSDREWVRLAEEIAFVRSYLDIEQVQFGERLQVRIDVETAVENIRIPAMIIQTLAENAIKHGIAMVRGQGLITISARVSDNRVLVSVEDNGPGFETAPRFDSSPDSSFSPGYGLRNVHGRLRAYFGDEAWLRCGRDAGGRSTVVSFEIPAVAESETGV